jgi:D-3-phosphoglycerate dehydrogenase
MLKQFNRYKEKCLENGLDVYCPEVTQTMTETELIKLVPQFDGWIIGDDPATRNVFQAGIKGKLKAAVKWGVGVDNVDFQACKELGIPITNIPNVFGEEVSDVAIGMMLCLTRQLHNVDIEIKKGYWIKPCGNSLSGKKVCLIGFGDIGRSVARKLLAFNLDVYVSDPVFEKINNNIVCKYADIKVPTLLNNVNIASLDEALYEADFIIVTCALNKYTHYLINKENILKAKKGVKIINVARGAIIKELDVIELLEDKFVSGVGFDVFEIEPLPMESKLRTFPQNIFSSHNGSNTIEGVDKTSYIAIEKIKEFLSCSQIV